MDENQAKKELENGYDEAEEMLRDTDKMEEFLFRLEKKLKLIPKLGDVLAYIPLLISLVRDFIRKRYSNIPVGTIIAIVSALLYVFNPFDIVPDAIPGAGYIDDTLVIGVCLKLIGSDVDEYRKWKEEDKDVS